MWIQGVKQMRSGILTDSSRHSLSLYGKDQCMGMVTQAVIQRTPFLCSTENI